MALKYPSGAEIKKGDRVLFHRQSAQIEFVAFDSGDPEAARLKQEYGDGILVQDAVAGRTFIPADQIDDDEDLEFESRAGGPPGK
jgi:hypothetical protein